MTFPLLFTVGWHQYSNGPTDAYGEVTPVYTPPLNQAGTQIAVYGFNVHSTSHNPVSGHDRIIVDAELWVPPGCPIGTYDYVDLPDGQYLVEGQPEDWGHGPFGWSPGLQINLRKISG